MQILHNPEGLQDVPSLAAWFYCNTNLFDLLCLLFQITYDYVHNWE